MENCIANIKTLSSHTFCRISTRAGATFSTMKQCKVDEKTLYFVFIGVTVHGAASWCVPGRPPNEHVSYGAEGVFLGL